MESCPQHNLTPRNQRPLENQVEALKSDIHTSVENDSTQCCFLVAHDH